MSSKLVSVIKYYDDYTIGYIRYGNVNIWAEYGSLTDSMYKLASKVKELKNSNSFY